MPLILYLWFSIQCFRRKCCPCHSATICSAVCHRSTTKNKYHIYNFTAAGDFKLLQLKSGPVH